jgi:hypothetical protein
MKMIEFFIPRKLLLLVFMAALNHTAPCAVKRAGIILIARGAKPRAFSGRGWGDRVRLSPRARTRTGHTQASNYIFL